MFSCAKELCVVQPNKPIWSGYSQVIPVYLVLTSDGYLQLPVAT